MRVFQTKFRTSYGYDIYQDRVGNLIYPLYFNWSGNTIPRDASLEIDGSSCEILGWKNLVVRDCNVPFVDEVRRVKVVKRFDVGCIYTPSKSDTV